MDRIRGYGRKAGGLLTNQYFIAFIAFTLAGFLGGLAGCQLFGKPEKDKCHKYQAWGIFISFILSLFLLGILGRNAFSKLASNPFADTMF